MKFENSSMGVRRRRLAPLAGAGALAASISLVAAGAGAADYRAYAPVQIDSALRRPLTLADCIGIALAKNLPLRIARSDYEIANARHSGSHAPLYPVLTAERSRAGSNLEDVRFGISSDSTSLSTNEINITTLAVEQILPTGAQVRLLSDVNIHQTFGRTDGRLFSAEVTQPLLGGAWPVSSLSNISETRYDQSVREENLEEVRRTTVLATRIAYYDALRDRAILLVSQEAVAGDSTLVLASEALLTAKLATRRDVLSAEIRLSEDRATLASSFKDYQLSLDRLKETIGIPIEMEVIPADTMPPFRPLELNAARLVSAALSNPLVRNAQIELERSRYQMRLARSAVWPRLDLTGRYTRTHDHDYLGSNEDQTETWFTGVRVSYPFLHRGTSADADAARLAHGQSQDRVALVQRQITVAVRDAARTVDSIAEEIAALGRGIESAMQKVDFSTAMFNLGRASNLDITDAREALTKARTGYAERLADYHAQIGVLESLTGLSLAEETR